MTQLGAGDIPHLRFSLGPFHVESALSYFSNLSALAFFIDGEWYVGARF